MYKSIKSCVMNNGMQSELFKSHVGLRQKERTENHSCLHYFLIIWKSSSQHRNGIHKILQINHYNDSNIGVNGMLNLFVLFYADDTVIMAEMTPNE